MALHWRASRAAPLPIDNSIFEASSKAPASTFTIQPLRLRLLFQAGTRSEIC